MLSGSSKNYVSILLYYIITILMLLVPVSRSIHILILVVEVKIIQHCSTSKFIIYIM
jgi:hypothetical protein